MTYLDLYKDAERKLEKNEITIGEFIEMIAPLRAEIPEREKGTWKMDDGTNAVCPICGKINGARGYFCKWCGADMRGE